MMSVPPAHAVDGTITINGEITDQTCKIEGQDPPYNLLVNLPKIGTKALKDVNSTAGATPFTIKLTDCPSTLSGDVKAYFEPGSSTDYGTGNLIAYTTVAPVGTAAAIPSPAAAVFNNVQIQLANPNGSVIKLGTDVQYQQAQAATLTAANGGSKQATLRYLAQYIKSGAGDIKAGKLVTYVQYSIVYP